MQTSFHHTRRVLELPAHSSYKSPSGYYVIRHDSSRDLCCDLVLNESGGCGEPIEGWRLLALGRMWIALAIVRCWNFGSSGLCDQQVMGKGDLVDILLRGVVRLSRCLPARTERASMNCQGYEVTNQFTFELG